MMYVRLNKKQLINKIKDLAHRDRCWVRDYNKLQKQLDKAEVDLHNEKEMHKREVADMHDAHNEDIATVKNIADNERKMDELNALRKSESLKDKIIYLLENRGPTFVDHYHSGSVAPTTGTSITTTGNTTFWNK